MKHSLSLWLIVCAIGYQFLFSCASDDESPKPQITSISVSSGIGGMELDILGSLFSTNINKNVVQFNGTAANVIYNSETQLRVQIPFEGTTGIITVTVDGVEVTGPVFTYAELGLDGPYYIKYKQNGSWMFFYSKEKPDMPISKECLTGYLQSAFPAINICQTPTLTTAQILALQGRSLPYPKNLETFALINIPVNYEPYTTLYMTSQPETSSFVIKDVLPDGVNSYGKNAYKVTGTFACKVSLDGKAPFVDISNGTFVLRVCEYKP